MTRDPMSRDPIEGDAQRQALAEHLERLRACTRCPNMHRPVVTGGPVVSSILLVGQAPGPREGDIGRPFAWTAGRTLFQWFESIGLAEEPFRERVFMAAVCRCFPGRKPKGGDRVPAQEEIDNCAPWLAGEFEILQPELLLPVGKLAISQFLAVDRLVDVVGGRFRRPIHGREIDIVPLPHPSGVSTWHRTDPGKELLQTALAKIAEHPAWQRLVSDPSLRPAGL